MISTKGFFVLYITLITAVKTTEPIVKINIVQTTSLVTLENVLVCFFSRIMITSIYYSFSDFTFFFAVLQEDSYKNLPFFK